MTPDEMSELLRLWEDGLIPVGAWQDGCDRRVVCVESDGPRRTWVLTEGGRQVGLVRMRDDGCGCCWAVEASDRTRAMLGLGES